MRAGHLLIAILLATAVFLVVRPMLARRSASAPLVVRDVPRSPSAPAPPAPPPSPPAPPRPVAEPAAPPTPPAASPPSLTIQRSTFAPGEKIRVRFTAPDYPDDAWIGVIPSEIPHGDEAVNDRHDVAYQHLDGRTDGEMVFVAPRVGQWDLRLHSTDRGGAETASVSFVVCEGVECARFPIGPPTAQREAAASGPIPGGVFRTADGLSLAGTWRGSDGRDCRVQQDGAEIWWLCLPRRLAPSWRIGHGTIAANAVTLRVAEIAMSVRSGDGQATGAALRGETLVLTVVAPDELRSLQGSGPGSTQLSWRRLRAR